MVGIDDPVQRVSSHWMSCLDNFIDYSDDTTKIVPYAQKIINKINYFVENLGDYSKTTGF